MPQSIITQNDTPSDMLRKFKEAEPLDMPVFIIINSPGNDDLYSFNTNDIVAVNSDVKPTHSQFKP